MSKGATSVESPQKGATDHEGLRTTDLEAVTSISTFLTSAVTGLSTTGLFNLATPAFAFSFLLWFIA